MDAVSRGRLDGEPTSDYYDMLVIGKTGMGKSSTVDKLLVPNISLITPPIEPGRSCVSQQSTAVGSGSSVDANSLQAKYEDLTGWVLCADENRTEQLSKVEKRLKNIRFCQQLRPNSHKEIDRLRGDGDYKYLYRSTHCCELLFNETSRVRVLDIPGFHGEKHYEDSKSTAESNLSIVRKIVHIQVVAGVRFRRVLYFLGPLQRSDRIMQSEIGQMVRYFGRSIFQRMVIVAIVPSHFSKLDEVAREIKFPQDVLDMTRQKFQEALEREFTEKNLDTLHLPKPPIVPVAMTDTCDDILDAVTSAQVQEDTGLQLEFNPNSCIRCSMTIGTLKDDTKAAIAIACPSDKSWSTPIPYSESTCHPRVVPKYTFKSIGQGFINMFRLKWCFSVEKCEHCSQGPGTRGCMRLGSKYNSRSGEITVDHSSKLDKYEPEVLHKE